MVLVEANGKGIHLNLLQPTSAQRGFPQVCDPGLSAMPARSFSTVEDRIYIS